MLGRAFKSDGLVRTFRESALRRERVTEQDAERPDKVADILTRVLDAIERLQRKQARDYIDFEDVACTSGTDVKLEHRFNARVRWWVVDWEGSAEADFQKDATNSDANTLVLDCRQTGTATIRVEVAQ